MAYQITFDKTIRRQIKDLPGHIKAIAKKEIAKLSDNPRPSRSKELEGYPSYYRLWIKRRWRLVWQVFDDQKVVDIRYVGPKSPDLYAYLGLERSLSQDEK